jgi:hypothetical protein
MPKDWDFGQAPLPAKARSLCWSQISHDEQLHVVGIQGRDPEEA